MRLLTTGNAKTVKGRKKGYQTYILHLAPHTVSEAGNVCPKATPGCIAACLNLAGRGGIFKEGGTNTIQIARKRKTRWFFEDRESFIMQLAQDIDRAIRQSVKKNMTPCVRLNGTSDIAWEKYQVGQTGLTLFELFPEVQFYDYTKILGRKTAGIANYHLTFSRAENNDKDCARALLQGMNVAAVYDQVPVDMFSADDTDLRFLDPVQGQVIGLKVKGHRAKKDYSGFIIRLTEQA